MSSRESVSRLEVDRSITSDRVLDVLVELFVDRGVPKHLRCDNGPEFIAKSLREHLENTDVEMLCIEPGSPWENGYVESFNSRLRDELLNAEEFEDLAEAKWHLAHTTRCVLTALWATRPRPSSRRGVPLPLRSLRSTSTPLRPKKQRKPLPKPNSHNHWYRKLGHLRSVPA